MFFHQGQYVCNDAAQCVILYSMTYIYFNIIQVHKNVEIRLNQRFKLNDIHMCLYSSMTYKC